MNDRISALICSEKRSGSGMTDVSVKFDALLLIGPPGVGKGTQGRLIGAIPGFLHVASGDIFRGLDQESDLGGIFREYSAKGELVPDELTTEMWYGFMKAKIDDGTYCPKTQMLVLDGIPRNRNQAEIMDQYIKVHKVISLVVDDAEELLKRMKRRAEKEGRFDDAREEVIRNRFEVYKNATFPMLDHYGDNHITEIDAIGTPGHVLLDILHAVIPGHEATFANALEK